MSRYIDADALIEDMQERYCKSCKEKGEDYNEVRCRACMVGDAIDDVDGFADNSIDIVRCKDCRHSEESLVSGSVYCNEMDRAISENGFCHKGERKTEPTISKMEQVDWKDQMWAEAVEDEPETERKDK